MTSAMCRKRQIMPAFYRIIKNPTGFVLPVDDRVGSCTSMWEGFPEAFANASSQGYDLE